MYSIALGAGLGVYYDLFRIARVALPHVSMAILLEDILFWSSSAFITFWFFLASDDGHIRIFLLLGEVIGFILYYFTVGVLVMKVARLIIGAVKWVLLWVYRIFIAPILMVIKCIWRILLKIETYLMIYFKKPAKISNLYLKKYRHLMYNQRSRFKQINRKNNVNNESYTNKKE